MITFILAHLSGAHKLHKVAHSIIILAFFGTEPMIDHEALAKQGDNAIGSDCPSICLSIRPPVCLVAVDLRGSALLSTSIITLKF